MADIAHSTRSHARLAPSAAHRWWVCPGSIRMSEGIDEKSSRYADEGTAAHTLAQHCFDKGFDADRFIGRYIDIDKPISDCFSSKAGGDRVFLVDEDMADSVQEYLDYARRVASKEGAEVKTESYVNLRWIGVAGLDGGTTDLSCYIQPLNELELIDYKHGRGVAVEPQDNKQLLCYALGVARRYSNQGLAQVRLTVVQPRCPHPQGSIRTWEVDVLDLFDFEDEIRERALATRDPDAPLVAGEHCKFCPAAAICEVRREQVLELAQAEFSALDEMQLPTVTTMDSAKLAQILAHASQIEDWIKRVEEHAYIEATHGRCPPGWKLVAKRATRKWRDEFQARGFVQGKFNLDEADILEVKLRSPAQIEPLLPGKNKAERASLIAEIVVKESSGTTLALEADKRPAVQVDAGAEFGAVE